MIPLPVERPNLFDLFPKNPHGTDCLKKSFQSTSFLVAYSISCHTLFAQTPKVHKLLRPNIYKIVFKLKFVTTFLSDYTFIMLSIKIINVKVTIKLSKKCTYGERVA
jgi:hypothetical protein